MRAGALDRVVILERLARTIDDSGAPVETWAALASMRAQLIQQSTDEFMRGFGESSEETAVFRCRWIDGVTTADRVTYGAQAFNIRQLKEIGRRRGLELRCEKVGP